MAQNGFYQQYDPRLYQQQRPPNIYQQLGQQQPQPRQIQFPPQPQQQQFVQYQYAQQQPQAQPAQIPAQRAAMQIQASPRQVAIPPPPQLQLQLQQRPPPQIMAAAPQLQQPASSSRRPLPLPSRSDSMPPTNRVPQSAPPLQRAMTSTVAPQPTKVPPPVIRSTTTVPVPPIQTQVPMSSSIPSPTRRPLPMPAPAPKAATTAPQASAGVHAKHRSLDLSRFPMFSQQEQQQQNPPTRLVRTPSPVKTFTFGASAAPDLPQHSAGGTSPTKAFTFTAPVTAAASTQAQQSVPKRRTSPPRFIPPNSSSSSDLPSASALSQTSASSLALNSAATTVDDTTSTTGSGSKFVPIWKRGLGSSKPEPIPLPSGPIPPDIIVASQKTTFHRNLNNSGSVVLNGVAQRGVPSSPPKANRPLPNAPGGGLGPGLVSSRSAAQPSTQNMGQQRGRQFGVAQQPVEESASEESGSEEEEEDGESNEEGGEEIDSEEGEEEEEEDGTEEEEEASSSPMPSPQYGIRDLPSRGQSAFQSRYEAPQKQVAVPPSQFTRQQPTSYPSQNNAVSTLPARQPNGFSNSSQYQKEPEVQSMTLRLAAVGMDTANLRSGYRAPYLEDEPPQAAAAVVARRRDNNSPTKGQWGQQHLPRQPPPQEQYQQEALPTSSVRTQLQLAQLQRQQQQQRQEQERQREHQQRQEQVQRQHIQQQQQQKIPIESPAPVGGRDKRANIPRITFGDANSDDEGSGPMIRVTGADGGGSSKGPPPTAPKIQVFEVPGISVVAPSQGGGKVVLGPEIIIDGEGANDTRWNGGSAHRPPQQQTPRSQPAATGKPRSGLACGGCQGAIVGRIVNAMGLRWHPTCFRCTVCTTLLEHVSSYEWEGRAYCHLDYHENFAPRCFTCKTAIVEERFISLDDPALGKRTYHEQHFFCAECGDPFLAPSSDPNDPNSSSYDVGFTVYRGHPYCEACHVRLRLPRCKRCKRSIRDGDEAVEALGGKYCWGCFVCKGCERPFEDPSFFERGGDPYCEHCFSVILRNEV